jgi:hypothetical protein
MEISSDPTLAATCVVGFGGSALLQAARAIEDNSSQALA